MRQPEHFAHLVRQCDWFRFSLFRRLDAIVRAKRISASSVVCLYEAISKYRTLFFRPLSFVGKWVFSGKCRVSSPASWTYLFSVDGEFEVIQLDDKSNECHSSCSHATNVPMICIHMWLWVPFYRYRCICCTDESGGPFLFYFVTQYLFTYKQNRYRIHPSPMVDMTNTNMIIGWGRQRQFWIILMKINRFNCVEHNR